MRCYGEVSHPIKKGFHWTQIKEFLIYVLFFWQKLMEVQRKPFPTISQESSLCHPWLSVCTFLPQTLKEHPSINILLSVSWGVLSSHKPGKREEVTKLRHPWSRFITWSQQEAYRSVTVQLFLQRPRQILSRSHKDRPSWKHFNSAHFQHKRWRH